MAVHYLVYYRLSVFLRLNFWLVFLFGIWRVAGRLVEPPGAQKEQNGAEFAHQSQEPHIAERETDEKMIIYVIYMYLYNNPTNRLM